TLTLAGAGGALQSTTGVTLNTGGSLVLDNTAANNSDRVADSVPVTLNGGTLSVLGNGTSASTESLGPITATSGNSVVTTTSGGAGVTLTAASLTRNAGATVSFQAGSGQTLGSAGNKITFTSSPSLTSGIIQGATTTDAAAGGFNLATYGANGVAAL